MGRCPRCTGHQHAPRTVTVAVTDVVTIAFAQPAEHVAAYWQAAPNASVTLAFSSDGVSFSEPVDAGRDNAEEESTKEGITYGAVLTAGGAVGMETDHRHSATNSA